MQSEFFRSHQNVLLVDSLDVAIWSVKCIAMLLSVTLSFIRLEDFVPLLDGQLGFN